MTDEERELRSGLERIEKIILAVPEAMWMEGQDTDNPFWQIINEIDEVVCDVMYWKF